MPEQAGVAAPMIEFTRSEQFASVYANNAVYEASAWDLKITLGILDQRGGKLSVEQHTSVSIPWPSAKMLLYYLQINILAYELENGKIKIPATGLPPAALPLPPELENNPLASFWCKTRVLWREV